LHVWFLTGKPGAPNLDALDGLKVESERYSRLFSAQS
jgi:hypothetical protein